MPIATSNKQAGVLPVMEAFYTIQGEGFHQGKAAYFIRLGGCDVGCVWCDVKESWDAGAHPQLSVEEMVAAASAFPGRLAVVTGGEPLDRKSTRLNSSHQIISYAVFCLKKKKRMQKIR